MNLEDYPTKDKKPTAVELNMYMNFMEQIGEKLKGINEARRYFGFPPLTLKDLKERQDEQKD